MWYHGVAPPQNQVNPMSAHGVLMEGSVTAALRKMAIPMGVGMFFMILVNIIDTYWVAQLGTEPLAAMTFTSA